MSQGSEVAATTRVRASPATWGWSRPHLDHPPSPSFTTSHGGGGLTTWRLGAWDGGTEWAGWQAWRADMDSVSLPGRVGEGRACWSLGNAYVSMGSPAQALTFAKKHLEISQEVSRACPALSPQACPSPVLEPSPGPSWRCLQTSGPCASVCPELFPGGHHLLRRGPATP